MPETVAWFLSQNASGLSFLNRRSYNLKKSSPVLVVFVPKLFANLRDDQLLIGIDQQDTTGH